MCVCHGRIRGAHARRGLAHASRRMDRHATARISAHSSARKIYFPGRKLSVQVHPDDVYAEKHEAAAGGVGKNEMWYVVSAREGAELRVGLRSERHAGIVSARHRRRHCGGLPRPRAGSRGRRRFRSSRNRAHDLSGRDALRNPAALGHYLPRIRLQPRGRGRQAARPAHSPGAERDAVRRQAAGCAIPCGSRMARPRKLFLPRAATSRPNAGNSANASPP